MVTRGGPDRLVPGPNNTANINQGVISRREFLRMATLLGSSYAAARVLAACAPEIIDGQQQAVVPLGVVGRTNGEWYHPKDASLLLPAPARNRYTFAPDSSVDVGRLLANPEGVSLVGLQITPEQALALNMGVNSLIIPVGLHKDLPNVVLPVFQANPELYASHLAAIGNADKLPSISIGNAEFFDALFADPDIGISLKSSQLVNGFRWNINGRNYSIGGQYSNLNADLRMIELLPTGRERLILFQIIKSETQQRLGYWITSSGVLPQDIRNGNLHYQARHTQDGHFGIDHPIGRFIKNLGDSAQAGFEDLFTGKDFRDPSSGVEFKTLITFKNGHSTRKILCHCTTEGKTIGAVLMFETNYADASWRHGFRPTMSVDATLGITTQASYVEGFTLLKQSAEASFKKNGPATIMVRLGDNLVEYSSEKFRGVTFEEFMTPLRELNQDMNIPPRAVGLSRWSGIKGFGIKLGGPILSILSNVPIGFAAGLEGRSFNQRIEDATQIYTTEWIQDMLSMDKLYTASTEIDVNRFLEAARANPSAIFLAKFSDGMWAERSSTEDGVYFSVVPATEVSEAELLVHPMSDTKTALVNQDEASVEYTGLSAGAGVHLPYQLVESIPTKSEYEKKIATLLVNGEKPNFPYRILEYISHNGDGQPEPPTQIFLTTFVKIQPDNSVQRVAYAFVYRPQIT